MSKNMLSGGCHCGNITVEIELPNVPSFYTRRVCACDFCKKHGASYISDRNGSLIIAIENKSVSGTYKQGSGIADFLVCKNCGVLVGVLYRQDGQAYGAVNSRAINDYALFGEEIAITPQQLSDSDKIQRWKNTWFSNVRVI